MSVGRWTEYLEDLDVFLNQAPPEEIDAPVFFLGHIQDRLSDLTPSKLFYDRAASSRFERFERQAVRYH